VAVSATHLRAIDRTETKRRVNHFHARAPTRRNAVDGPGLVPVQASAIFATHARTKTAGKKGSRGALARAPVADSAKSGYRCHEFQMTEPFGELETTK
jgi:hypothetical protein